jgi:hypothetical protein
MCRMLFSVGGHQKPEDLSIYGRESRRLPSAARHGNGDDILYGFPAIESSMAHIRADWLAGHAKPGRREPVQPHTYVSDVPADTEK